MQALSLAIQSVLSGYYATAPHRRAVALPDPAAGRLLHYFRAMCHFEPAEPFLNELRRGGYSPRVFRLPAGEESYLLHPWPFAALRALEYFSRHPEAVGDDAVFVGHSAGGFSVYLLAALAGRTDVASFQRALARFAPHARVPLLSITALQTLADALKGASFVSVGTPYEGVTLRRIGRLLNDHFFQPLTPMLVEGLRRSYLSPLYARFGAKPGSVLHGQMISRADPLSFSRNPIALPYEAILQGGMRLVARMTLFDLYDGIAPWSATYVPEIPEREILALDHLRLVETAEPAARLVRLIERIQTREGTA